MNKLRFLKFHSVLLPINFLIEKESAFKIRKNRLKGRCNEKWVGSGMKTVLFGYSLASRVIPVWTYRFSVQLIISVSGCYSFINRHCLDKFWPKGWDQFPLHIQDMNIYNANSIGADVFNSWIGEAEKICRINIQTTAEFADFLGSSPGITYWRSYNWEEHFDPASPIRRDNA